MTTLQQVLKRKRKKKRHKKRSPRLNKNPQIRAVCMKISIRKPKKPNSAQRKIARVFIPRWKKGLTIYIPGQGHSLQKFSAVLIRGGRVKDLPGIKYKAIRGKYDFSVKETFERKKSRSKYGLKKNG